MDLEPTPGSAFMRMRLILIAALGLPLAGCLGVTLPPKQLPEWAMSPQVEAAAPARVRVARRMPVQRAPDQTAAVSYVAPSSSGQPAQQAEVMPFSPEWHAREEAFDSKLRRSMNICRGC
jgi:hypothetical protein